MNVFHRSEYCLESNTVVVELGEDGAFEFSALSLGYYNQYGVFCFSPSFAVWNSLKLIFKTDLDFSTFRSECLSKFSFSREQFKKMTNVETIVQSIDVCVDDFVLEGDSIAV